MTHKKQIKQNNLTSDKGISRVRTAVRILTEALTKNSISVIIILNEYL